MPRGSKPKPPLEIGSVYHRFTVIGDAEPRQVPGKGTLQSYTKVRCQCGTEKEVKRTLLVNGIAKSCGCLGVEHGHRLGRSHLRHGQCKSRTYTVWSLMKARCSNSTKPRWEDYGGRGITVCERWQKFENFLEDMGERPPNTSIERIDNDGNYEPGNCKWGTLAEQARNKRTNVFVVLQGTRMILTDAAVVLGSSPPTIQNAAKRTGLPTQTIVDYIAHIRTTQPVGRIKSLTPQVHWLARYSTSRTG